MSQTVTEITKTVLGSIYIIALVAAMVTCYGMKRFRPARVLLNVALLFATGRLVFGLATGPSWWDALWALNIVWLLIIAKQMRRYEGLHQELLDLLAGRR